MPRHRNNDNDNDIKVNTEEDYLDVDKPLPGQNYFCISFVSPEKVLQQKLLFMYYNYERAFYKKLTDIMHNSLSKLIETSDDGKIDVVDVIKINKDVNNAYINENVNFDKFKSNFEDFCFRDEEQIGAVFDKQHNFNTSVRGVKVRGSFDTKREADIRASVLQRMDPLFDVFVGQVGFWCPWDPNPQKIADIEYMNHDLNKLVKEYKSNESKKDQFYQEQKTQRQKDALSVDERLKHQAGLNDMREFQKQTKENENANSNVTIDADASATTSASTSTSTQQFLDVSEQAQSSQLNNMANIICMNSSENNINDITENIITQSLNLSSTEISIDQQSNILQSDDPWIQHKNI